MMCPPDQSALPSTLQHAGEPHIDRSARHWRLGLSRRLACRSRVPGAQVGALAPARRTKWRTPSPLSNFAMKAYRASWSVRSVYLGVETRSAPGSARSDGLEVVAHIRSQIPG